MNREEMVQKLRALKICGFAASGVLMSYVFTAAVLAQTPSRAPRYQVIKVVNHGGFVMRAQPHWKCTDGKSGSFPMSSSFPVGQEAKWDMAAAQGITTGCEMWAHMDIVAGLGSDPDSPRVEYAPNGHVVTFTVKGTTGNKWVEKD
jgi:hypothetical protein